MHRLNDGSFVAREYATLDRLAMRRLDRTGWLRFDELDEEQTLLAAVAEVRPARILDVACGDGRLASLFAAERVVVLDSSPAAVGAAADRGLDARLGDAQDLPFEDASFDVVTCSHALYHVPDVDQALAEFVRVLRPGGRFVGIYNGHGHMSELWDVVGPDWLRDDFDSETGLPLIKRHFGHVERRMRGGAVLWLSRLDLQTYLDAYIEMFGPMTAPESPYPFVAHREKCVFVADAA